MTETRSRTIIPFIGQPTNTFSGDVFPTIQEVLCVYFFHHTVEGLSQKDAMKKVILDVFAIWGKVNIPICSLKNAVRKLQSQLSMYRNLCRNTKRGGTTQRDRENIFAVSITDLFDISQQDALNSIVDDNIKLFLKDQRKNRKFCIRQLQKTHGKYQKDELEQLRLESKKNDQLLEDDDVDSLILSLSQLSSNHELNPSQSNLDSDCYPCSGEIAYESRLKRSKIGSSDPIVTKDVSMALDRANVSNAKAVHVLAAIANQSGKDKLKDVSLSISTVRRIRNLHRSKEAARAKDQFTFEGPLVVHFDGKLLSALSGASNKEDRIAVMVSGQGVEKLLGVPKINSGKGALIAEATFSMIEEWCLKDNIVGLSFDTTAANTGLKNGACILLEQKIGKALLWLACRHHILEIICRNVFSTVFGSTDGPNVALFKRFKDFWSKVNREIYTPCNDERLDGELRQLKIEAVEFIQNALSQEPEKLPRDDYRELLELALLFLGETPPRGAKIRAPGAFHHARWMSKLIYIFKIYIFREQFTLTRSEKNSCREFALFAALVYLKSWMTCPHMADAPHNDLLLIKNIKSYEKISKPISDSALTALSRHLWYLGQELAVVSLFSDLLTIDAKRKIVSRLKNNKNEKTEHRSLKYTKKDDLSGRTLDHFIGPASHFIFKVLNLSTSFLEEDVNKWETLHAYQQAKQIIRALSPVNDRAERGIALATEYNKSRTKDEQQYQYLLQGVEAHRKQFPNAQKNTLMK